MLLQQQPRGTRAGSVSWEGNLKDKRAVNSSRLPKGMILKAQQQTVPVQGKTQKRGKRTLSLHWELFEDPKSEAAITEEAERRACK